MPGRAGIQLLKPPPEVKCRARSSVWTVPTRLSGPWIKFPYTLPPGEELVLAYLSEGYPNRVPHVVAGWESGFAALKILGKELGEQDADRDLGVRGPTSW